MGDALVVMLVTISIITGALLESNAGHDMKLREIISNQKIRNHANVDRRLA